MRCWTTVVVVARLLTNRRPLKSLADMIKGKQGRLQAKFVRQAR